MTGRRAGDCVRRVATSSASGKGWIKYVVPHRLEQWILYTMLQNQRE